jgi:hypothetical protein
MNSEPGNRAGDATVPWRAIADARNEKCSEAKSPGN